MRADKFKKKIKKINVVNIFENKDSFKSDFKPYKDDYWIVGRLTNMNVRVDTIFSEIDFEINRPLVIKLYNFLKKEKEFLTDKSLQVLCYDLRYFFRYVIETKGTIELEELDYDFLDEYAITLKQNKESKNKYEKAKKILNKMIKYDYFNLHEDIYNNNFPVHQNFKKPEKQNDNYSEEVFKNIANCLLNIIEDYFKGKIEQEHFTRASYWFISFCTGFNKTAMDNLQINHIDVTKNKDDIFYLITGLKNRGVKGYQQSRISVSKGHIFDKVINELFTIQKEINKKYKIENNLLFNYEYKNTIKNYNGNKFNQLGIIEYLKKYNLENIPFSTQKMRNQWSLKMLSISDSVNKVSEMLDHSNIDITLSHYLKSRLHKNTIIKFKMFQELLYQYSHNDTFDKWTEFQSILGINDSELEDVVSKINKGYYEKATGNCISSEEISCSNYFNCFNCKNYSILGEKDLWKIISMRESIIDENNIKFNWLIETLNEILKDFDRESIMKARKLRIDKGRHPFWKNQIMVKTIMNNYEDNE